MNARVKRMPDEAACADACDTLECEGYAYVLNGTHAAACWVYGEKLDQGPQYASGELATNEWQGFSTDFAYWNCGTSRAVIAGSTMCMHDACCL